MLPDWDGDVFGHVGAETLERRRFVWEMLAGEDLFAYGGQLELPGAPASAEHDPFVLAGLSR
jgi:hypothetical protein